MLFPSLLYGPIKVVRSRIRPIVAGLAKGASPADVNWGEMIDTSEHPRARIIAGRPLLLPGDVDYQGSVLVNELLKKFAAQRVSMQVFVEYFAWALLDPWRFLGLLGDFGNVFFLGGDHAEWRQPFLRAARRHWPSLESEGARYLMFGSEPRLIRQVAVSVLPVLKGLGAPMDPNPFTTPGRTRELLEAFAPEDPKA